jgi:aspartyl-tRNA(Asn)/glutamyl-tRNA(Gln) amidotransferase subunit C
MKLGPEQTAHVAYLAHLELKPEELELFSTQLTSILSYIDQLRELDVSGVEPLVHVGEARNVFRSDGVCSSLAGEEVLRNAPKQRDGFFCVPYVFG